jgi:hypothetical protein
MACQFGRRAVFLTAAAGVILAIPLLWLAGKYIPGEAGKRTDSSGERD